MTNLIESIITTYETSVGADVERLMKTDSVVPTVQHAMDRMRMDPEDAKSRKVCEAFENLRVEVRRYYGHECPIQNLTRSIEAL